MRALRSASVAAAPRNLAEWTPGAPPSASTSIPESSASAGRPVADEAATAFAAAFSA